MTSQSHLGKRLGPQRLPVWVCISWLIRQDARPSSISVWVVISYLALRRAAIVFKSIQLPACFSHPSCRCCTLIKARRLLAGADCCDATECHPAFMTRACQPLALTPRVGVRLNFLTRWYCVTHPPQPKKGRRSREKQFARARNAACI